MKTEELNALKEEVETLNKKFAELTEEELKDVIGGRTTISPQNDIKYDAVSLGNHEFEFKIDPLLNK